MQELTNHLLELIRITTTQLPSDIKEALQRALENEETSSNAKQTLQLMLANAKLACQSNVPLCQDTGCLIFFVDRPATYSERVLRQHITTATALATDKAYLRPNAVDPICGQNSLTNIGNGSPQVYVQEWDEDYLRIRLLLKGGGSENVSCQYSLPNATLGAGRDLEGVRRVLLHAVHTAQGQGCAPGILGVCIGGDRGQGYLEAKRQLLRSLPDINPIPELATLEKRVLSEANNLGIGPLGLGGHTTLLAVKVGALHRHPASFFVSVSYMCWQCRRATLICRPNGDVEFHE